MVLRMIVVGEAVLRELVPMRDAINAVADAFRAVSEGRVDQPQRLASRDARALMMLARISPTNHTAVKVITATPENPGVGRPSIQAVVLWFDGTTGEPAALIEGAALTALRTGAASGLATRLLARPDAHVLAMLGAGAQARDQIDAVCAARDVREIRLVSRNGMSSRSLAAQVSKLRPETSVEAVDSVADALAGADIVCCATTSTYPLVVRADLADDAHINAIGAYTPAMCELAPDVLAGARIVVVDRVSAALEEAGDILQAIDVGAFSADRLCELGDLLVGAETFPVSAGFSVFKSVGIAAQDWAIAQLAYERAVERPWVAPSVPLSASGTAAVSAQKV